MSSFLDNVSKKIEGQFSKANYKDMRKIAESGTTSTQLNSLGRAVQPLYCFPAAFLGRFSLATLRSINYLIAFIKSEGREKEYADMKIALIHLSNVPSRLVQVPKSLYQAVFDPETLRQKVFEQKFSDLEEDLKAHGKEIPTRMSAQALKMKEKEVEEPQVKMSSPQQLQLSEIQDPESFDKAVKNLKERMNHLNKKYFKDAKDFIKDLDWDFQDNFTQEQYESVDEDEDEDLSKLTENSNEIANQFDRFEEELESLELAYQRLQESYPKKDHQWKSDMNDIDKLQEKFEKMVVTYQKAISIDWQFTYHALFGGLKEE